MKNLLSDNLFIESIRYEHGEMPLIEHHIQRLHRIGIAFGLSTTHIDTKYLDAVISSYLPQDRTFPVKIRLEFDSQRHTLELISVQAERIEPSPIIRLTIFSTPKDSLSPNAHYKTNNALLYTDSIAYAHQNSCDQSIIINERNEVVETSYCNIFFRKGDIIYTPPLSSGCVAGIMRNIFITENTVIEKTIYPHDIPSYDHIILTNAVRGVMEGKI